MKNIIHILLVSFFLVVFGKPAPAQRNFDDSKIIKSTYKLNILRDSIIDNKASVVFGRIYDGRTNKPITGALVRVKNTTLISKTDSLGNFYLIVPIGRYKLKVEFVGNEPFETKKIKLKDSESLEFIIKLGSRIIT